MHPLNFVCHGTSISFGWVQHMRLWDVFSEPYMGMTDENHTDYCLDLKKFHQMICISPPASGCWPVLFRLFSSTPSPSNVVETLSCLERCTLSHGMIWLCIVPTLRWRILRTVHARSQIAENCLVTLSVLLCDRAIHIILCIYVVSVMGIIVGRHVSLTTASTNALIGGWLTLPVRNQLTQTL